jgi:tetratricopeptide (TPR) repeat protein
MVAEMSDRQGSTVLFVLACAVVLAGVLSSDPATRVALCALGVGLAVAGVGLPRLAALKLGPAGIEATLRDAKQVAAEKSKAVGETLDAGGFDLTSLATGQVAERLSASVEQSLKRDLEALEGAVERIESAVTVDDTVPPSALLELARGSMAVGAWREAAAYLDRYVPIKPRDWDAQFSRAVAHANSRTDNASDLDALRAYNEALALRPASIDRNLLARLFSYRGAMLKRLDRLDEAEADLRIAESYASDDYELADITYNRACVAAMDGRRDAALEFVRRLRGTEYIAAIRAHLDDYFVTMADDEELIALLR